MADGVTYQSGTLATPAAGIEVATDDCGAAGHTEIVKLAISTDGSATLIPADATNGLDVDVTRLPALVAGTANIGDVDVLTVPAPLSTTGGGTEATALRVTVATDSTGVLSVDDNGGSLTVDGTVAVSGTVTVGSHAVTNAGTFAVQESGAALTALQLLDDSVVADNAAFTDGTTKLTMSGFIYDEVAGTALTENDAAAARVNLNRAQVGIIEDGATRGRWATVSAANALKVDGSAVTQPVSGTVALSAGAANIGDVDVLTVPAPLSTTGGGTEATALRVTLANDSTGLVSVDDNGGSLTVDVGTALPAGTNNIGDVDVLSVVPGTAATNLGKAEDAGHTTGDTGVMALAVRNDAGTALAGTDLDYIPLSTDANGALRVTGGGGGTEYTEGNTDASITGSAILWEDTADTLRSVSAATPLPVNIISGAGSGGTAMTDDSAFTPAASNVTPAGAFFDDTAPDSVNEGDIGALRMSANRNLYATLRDAAGNERGVNVTAGNALTVDGSATTQPVSGTVTANLAAGTNNIGDVDVLTVPAPLSTTGGGTEATALRVTIANDSTGLVSIDDNGGAITVDNAGTFAVQVDGNALTALQLIDDTIVADDAAFTVGTTKVGMAGFFADEASTDSVDEGDAGAARMTLDRKVIVTSMPHTNGGLTIFRSLDLDESEEEVKATAGQVYSLWFTNTATTTRWLKFYNATAASVTVGTTTPVLTLGLPGNASDDVSGVFGGAHGFVFDTAITVAATTGVADADTGAPAANDVIVNIGYK